MLGSLTRFADNSYWVLILIAAPFLLFPTPDRAWIMLVVPLGWLLAWVATGKPLPLTPLNGSLLVLYVMVLVSLRMTGSMEVSLPKICQMVLGIGLFVLVARHGEKDIGWWLWFAFLLVVGFAVGIAALLGTGQGAGVRPLLALPAEWRSVVTWLPGVDSGIQKNVAAGTLLLILPVLLGLTVVLPLNFARLRERLGIAVSAVVILSVWVAGIIVAAVLLLTGSYGAYAGLAVALLAMGFIPLPRIGRLLFLIVLLLALLPVVTLVVQVGPEALWNWAGANVVGIPPAVLSAKAHNLHGRMEIWDVALRGIRDFPLTGMGMNTFRGLVHVLFPASTGLPADIGHAHNEYLQVGLDLGVPGLISYIALYFGAFWMGIDIWRKAAVRRADGLPEPSALMGSSVLTRALVLGLGCGLLAHAVHATVDTLVIETKPGILFWMLLGLICGLHAQSERLPGSDV